jgi:hypothetical protein
MVAVIQTQLVEMVGLVEALDTLVLVVELQPQVKEIMVELLPLEDPRIQQVGAVALAQ